MQKIDDEHDDDAGQQAENDDDVRLDDQVANHADCRYNDRYERDEPFIEYFSQFIQFLSKFFMDQRYSKRPNKLATTKPPRKTIVHKIHSLIDPAKPACLKMIAVEPTTIPIIKA